MLLTDDSASDGGNGGVFRDLPYIRLPHSKILTALTIPAKMVPRTERLKAVRQRMTSPAAV